jgi:hypothetical protein
MNATVPMKDATYIAESLMRHQPYPLTEGGFGCLSAGCEATHALNWQEMAGHLARRIERECGNAHADS